MWRFAVKPYRVLLLVLAGALVSAQLTAASAKYRDSGHFVTELGNRAIELLTSTQITEEEQELLFRSLLREGFAVEKIGRFVLGRYRRDATEAEINEFLNLFEDYIVSLYSSAFKSYSGETFEVERVIQTRSSRDTMVVTQIIPESNGPSTKIVFQVRNSDDDYKILDVRVQGANMIVTQRDEFTGLIRNNGGKVQALIEALRKKTATLRTRADTQAQR